MNARVGARLLLVPVGLAAALGLLALPGARRLAGRQRSTLEGVVTLDDAVAACRQTGLQGWDLVAYAQHLVACKFAVYTVLNLWDAPARAFAYGMGYCSQYNLALKQILDRLGFATQAVSSAHVRVLDNPDWKMGHTWLRVRHAGVEREVCAGRRQNRPGSNGFVPVSPAWRAGDATLLLSHLGMFLLVGAIEWRSLLTGRPAPEWTYHPNA